MRRIVVVGASLAGTHAALALREEGFDGELVIVGAEAAAPYDRPPLSKGVLTGAVDAADVALGGLEDLRAEWVLGTRATRLDAGARRLVLDDGRELRFDGLVVATGSAPRRLAELDVTRDGVHELRTLADAVRLRDALVPAHHAVIVGAGFIGVEIASAARELGVGVTMVTLDPPLAHAGALVSDVTAAVLAEHGVPVLEGRAVAALLGDRQAEGVVLDDGTRVAADLVVAAVGATPCAGWLRGSGLRLDGGVLCDAWALAAPGVVAAGDVACRPYTPTGRACRVEHWSNAVEQGRLAAATLLHGPRPGDAVAALPSFWSEHFGLRLQSVGFPELADEVDVVQGAVADRRFAALARRDGRPVGGVAYGMPRAVARLRAELLAHEDEAVPA